MTYHLKDTAVAFFIFNRLDTAKKVFAEIRKAQPPKLFVIADGPRDNHPGEAEKCQACRDLIKHVDWECEVFTNFSDKNLGCGVRPKTGYDWVFEHVNEAIFLEDDCLVDNSLFRFHEELLEKYRDDDRVAMISGINLQPKNVDYQDESYYFSKIPATFGWATWKRVWHTYDYDIKKWPQIKKNDYFRSFLQGINWYVWAERFDELYSHRFTSAWDTQFVFNVWINNGLCIVPSKNLASHIGYVGTHYDGSDNYQNNEDSVTGRPTSSMQFPLHHPDIILSDYKKDEFIYKWHCGSTYNRFRLFLHIMKKRLLNKISML